jgi:RimJ/RimL family protein N-acetyltransferase
MDERAAEAFAVSAARSIHPLVRSWYDETQVVENARAWLAPELRLVGDLEHAREFQALCPRPGVAAEDYANRIVPLGDGADALAGVRFRPAKGRFFVDLVAATRPVRDAAELARTARRLGVAFAAFDPGWIRVYATDEALALAAAGAVGDFVLAARVADLRAVPPRRGVTVVRRSAAEVHARYALVYAAFHAEAPRNAALAHVEDFDTVARWEKDGGVFEVLLDGAPAGFCGARRWDRYGVRGWCAAEIILERPFRGRGIAADVHRAMARAIDAAAGDAMWADVHEENAASLRAGLRAGYSIIGRVINVATA